jgi:hypothetical protein
MDRLFTWGQNGDNSPLFLSRSFVHRLFVALSTTSHQTFDAPANLALYGFKVLVPCFSSSPNY